MLRRHLIAAIGLAVAAGPVRAQPARPAFAVGQVWSVKGDAPTSTRVIIGKLEDFGGRPAVHISLVEVPVPPGLAASGPTMMLAHMPFDGEALARTVDRLVSTGVEPPAQFEQGYAEWKAAHGGVFTISIPEALDLVFRSIPKTP